MLPPTVDELCFDACDRFFSINELVSMVLHEVASLDLINCQRVCKLWNTIISRSSEIQEALFLQPAEQIPCQDGEQPFFRINPFLWKAFGPILVSGPATTFPWRRDFATSFHSYDNLSQLPWARDGLSHTAPARQAFARKEASWRKMLVTQPPIQDLDWWYVWDWEEDRPPIELPFGGGTITSLPDSAYGWGGQEFECNVTIGHLWDLVEATMKRGCEARVIFQIHWLSRSVDDGESWWRDRYWSDFLRNHHSKCDGPPRVQIQTRHAWVDQPPDYEAFSWMTKDCALDSRQQYPRWSQSDGFAYPVATRTWRARWDDNINMVVTED